MFANYRLSKRLNLKAGIPITVHNRSYSMGNGNNRRTLEGRFYCRLNKFIRFLIYIRRGLVNADDLR